MKKIFMTLGLAGLMMLGACGSKNAENANADTDTIIEETVTVQIAPPASVASAAEAAVQQAKEKTSEAVETAKEKTSEAMQTAKDKAAQGVQNAKEKAGQAAQDAGNAVNNLLNK